jgi:hypothetical protein
MSAEDLTVRAGLALRQAFLDAHPDLYEQRHGADSGCGRLATQLSSAGVSGITLGGSPRCFASRESL